MWRLSTLAIVAIAIGLLASSRAAAEPKHPHLHHALYEMREADKELTKTTFDFHDSKAIAQTALHKAIVETEKALAAAGDPYSDYQPAQGIYADYNNHPHLRHALHEMRRAHQELNEASHNFGGHKQKAMQELDVAITEVQKCIDLLPSGGAAAEPKHPHLHHALYEMREADKELTKTTFDFHDSKAIAQTALHKAIVETEKALAAAGDPYRDYQPAQGIYADYNNHPHLRHALHEMRRAHQELKEASHNFGGHKQKAMQDLDVAITEVQKCIDLLPSGSAAAEPKHPHLHHALYEMREADKELTKTTFDFHDSKAIAQTALHKAIVETEKALAAAGDPYRDYQPAQGIYADYNNHPHLRHALHEMRLAHQELKETSHNFGGHKQKAMKDLDVATTEVQKCVDQMK